jgi:AcrR family transcriptional regulator
LFVHAIGIPSRYARQHSPTAAASIDRPEIADPTPKTTRPPILDIYPFTEWHWPKSNGISNELAHSNRISATLSGLAHFAGAVRRLWARANSDCTEPSCGFTDWSRLAIDCVRNFLGETAGTAQIGVTMAKTNEERALTMAKSASATSATPVRNRSSPRTPSRNRGVQRYQALVDATEALLLDRSPEDVGLYQIAERAGVPPASAYHFFPTKEAAFFALAQRYLEWFQNSIYLPVSLAGLRSWQDLMATDLRGAMTYYNSHPPALKLLYGGYGGLATKQADFIMVERLARSMYARYEAAFHMPFVREPEKKFHLNMNISDAIWGYSYVRHGEITEAYYEEALNACIAYCRLFLPERVELRDEFKLLVEKGERAVLRPPQDDAATA